MINENELTKVFTDCLFESKDIKDGKPIRQFTLVQGIIFEYHLDTAKVMEHKEYIEKCIKELPETFADGWSFINLCLNKDCKSMWTSDQRRAEQILILAMAINKAEYIVGRECWKLLPGGMPYIKFDMGVN